jgi:hypothetical protein
MHTAEDRDSSDSGSLWRTSSSQATHALSNWTPLTRFLDDEQLPPDNNASESALRVVALGRKNYLFVGNEDAGHNVAGLYSLVATCEANGVNPLDYLSDVLLRVQDHPAAQIDDLLPPALEVPPGLTHVLGRTVTRTRSGALVAASCATPPPWDRPRRNARSISSAVSNPRASSARSSSRYGDVMRPEWPPCPPIAGAAGWNICAPTLSERPGCGSVGRVGLWSSRVVAYSVALMVTAGCGSATIRPGGVGDPCFGNHTCNAGLTCASGLCVSFDAGTSASGGVGSGGRGYGGTGGAIASGGTTGSGGSGGSSGGGSTGTAGTHGTGAATGAGGTVSTGGASGTGGAFGTGGSAGAAGTAGAKGGGGATGSGGVSGTGGMTCTDQCTNGATQCVSGSSFQSCVISDGCTTWATTNCATAMLVCEGPAPAGCVDPNWAEWPMPNGPVDVSNGAPNAESYTINGDGTVTDNVTGLMWQQAVPSTPYAWSDAVAYCPTLTLGAHSDWRLPTIIELVSLIDYSVGDDNVNPSINATVFPGTPISPSFWSSTPLASSPSSEAWALDFALGGVTYLVVNDPGEVRCVR